MTLPHPLPDARWPDADEAKRSLLFSPMKIGATVTARTRTWVPAMVPWRATEDGYVTDDNVEWYARFARGRPGVLVVEATGIRDVPSGPLLRIGHDRFIPGLARMVDAVRRASGGQTRVLIQIIDFLRIRRRPERERFLREFLSLETRHRDALAVETGNDAIASASEVDVRAALIALEDTRLASVLSEREHEALTHGDRERVTDVHLGHVCELPRVLPELFAAAADRAKRAGFDGVELHFAHAYTMASFLSRLNTRDDGYGSSREGRVRLALEVIAAVRERVGAEFCVGCRYLGDEAIAGGSDLDDARYFGVAFAKAGLDFLSISKGGKFEDAKQPQVGDAAYPYTGKSGLECMPTVRIDERGPFGRNVSLAAAIRADVRAAGFETPIITAGGLCTFDQAESILRNGEADFVGAARQSLADPDWWLKVEEGRGAQILRCTYTNYCEGLDQKHKQVTCKLWDKDFTTDPASIKRTNDGKRRLLPP